MPTISECLKKTAVAIRESDEVLRNSHQHKNDIQAQVEASRQVIAESLTTLRIALQNTKTEPPQKGLLPDA